MNSYDAYMEEDWDKILENEKKDELVFKNNRLLHLKELIKENNL